MAARTEYSCIKTENQNGDEGIVRRTSCELHIMVRCTFSPVLSRKNRAIFPFRLAKKPENEPICMFSGVETEKHAYFPVSTQAKV